MPPKRTTDELIDIVPQQYEEVVMKYPILEEIDRDEWGNGTTGDNARQAIEALYSRLEDCTDTCRKIERNRA